MNFRDGNKLGSKVVFGIVGGIERRRVVIVVMVIFFGLYLMG